MVLASQSSFSSSVYCRLNVGPNDSPLNAVKGRSRTCSSGEVGGVVDFREEEAVLVRRFEDEAAETDNRSDCFPDDDLGFWDVVVETEGAVESGRREAALVFIALVETTRLVGLSGGRVPGRRGDFEVFLVMGLIAFLTSSGDSASVFAGRKLVSISATSKLGHTGLPRSLGSSHGTRWLRRQRKYLLFEWSCFARGCVG